MGLGIGGEQPVGTAYLAEELSESQRKIGAGLMHTGYYFGFFFASVANYFIGANFGWRWMFVFGGLPALLIGFIQFGVKESTKWKEKIRRRKAHARPKMTRLVCQAVLAELRAPDDGDVGAVPDVDHRTVGGIDLRAHGDVTARGQELARPPPTPRGRRRTAGWCSPSARSSDASPRRSSPNASAGGKSMAIYFVFMAVSIVLAFGYVFYLAKAR